MLRGSPRLLPLNEHLQEVIFIKGEAVVLFRLHKPGCVILGSQWNICWDHARRYAQHLFVDFPLRVSLGYGASTPAGRQAAKWVLILCVHHHRGSYAWSFVQPSELAH